MNTTFFEGIEYTNEFLRDAINNYKQLNTPQPPPLNDDIWMEIMFCSTANTLKNLCLTHKTCHKIYMDKTFWKNKFAHDASPPLIIMTELSSRMKTNPWVYIPSSMKKLPNINEYVSHYKKMIQFRNIAMNVALRIKGKKLYLLALVEAHETLLWLPSIIIDYFIDNISLCAGELNLYFSFDNEHGFCISVNNAQLNNLLRVPVSQNEFIDYFTLLLYYESDYSKFRITDGEYKLNIQDLKRNTDKVKLLFCKF